MENNTIKYFQQLVSSDSQVEDRYIAVFELKTIGSHEAVDLLIKAFLQLQKFDNPSCLILHEIAYALGQLPMQFSEKLIPFLISIIENEDNFDVVRHEAAEALANQGKEFCLKIFQKYIDDVKNDPIHVLKDTCLVAIEKIITFDSLQDQYGKQYCGTREPAAPFSEHEIKEFLKLQSLKDIIEFLKDESVQLFKKYRAIYYLRNLQSQEAIYELTTLLESDKLGALIKHEICFILGQIGKDCPVTIIPILERVCADQECAAIVRHEALAAFQTVNGNKEQCKQFLSNFINDEQQIVRETAKVSLKVSEFWNC